MEEPLLDKAGFPRSDIDVHAVRIARHDITVLQNDHVVVVARLEKASEGHTTLSINPPFCLLVYAAAVAAAVAAAAASSCIFTGMFPVCFAASPSTSACMKECVLHVPLVSLFNDAAPGTVVLPPPITALLG